VIARLLQGVGAAIASPTGLALIATTFPKGPGRNAATAVFGAMTGVGSVLGLVVGGALAELSWRLAFLVNVPIGLLMIYLAYTTLRETHRERLKLDATGAILATLGCTAAVYGFSMGPEKGWLSAVTVVSGIAALVFLAAFVYVERAADNPVVPFDLFRDPNRVATFAAIFLAGGVMFTVSVLIGVYVQDILGYSALRAGIGFVPFAIAMGIGLGASSQLVRLFPPRLVVIGGGTLVLGAMLYGTTLSGGIPYFPNFVVPLVVAGVGIGMIVVPLTVSAIAGVGFDQIGPVSAIALMLQNLGGPVVLAIIQAVITSRTLYLGGTTGPVKSMNRAQLRALDHGYTYGLLWVAAVAVAVGAAALFICYTSDQVARAQDVKEALDAGEI
jgi:MFS family permease